MFCFTIHRDIKPSNILIQCCENDFKWGNVNTALLTLKLGDFGTSRTFEDMGRHKDDVTIADTMAYWPPEFVEAWKENMQKVPSCGYGIDTWATGIIAFVMSQGHLPGTPNISLF